MDGKKYVGMREYARIVGCDVVIISRAIKSQDIPASAILINDRGKKEIDLQLAEQEWGNHYRQTRRKSKNRKESIIAPAGFSSTPESPAGDPSLSGILDGEIVLSGGNISYKEADRLGKIADTQLRQLKVAELKGSLVKAETIEKTFFEFARTLRNGFQNISDRIIDQILSAGSRNEAHILLQNEIDQVLTSLSKLPEFSHE